MCATAPVAGGERHRVFSWPYDEINKEERRGVHQALYYTTYDAFGGSTHVQIRCSRLHNRIDPIGEVVNDQSIRPKNINHVNATDQRSLGTRSRARVRVESAKKAKRIEIEQGHVEEKRAPGASVVRCIRWITCKFVVRVCIIVSIQ